MSVGSIEFNGGGAFYADLKARVRAHLAEPGRQRRAQRPDVRQDRDHPGLDRRLLGPPGLRRRDVVAGRPAGGLAGAGARRHRLQRDPRRQPRQLQHQPRLQPGDALVAGRDGRELVRVAHQAQRRPPHLHQHLGSRLGHRAAARWRAWRRTSAGAGSTATSTSTSGRSTACSPSSGTPSATSGCCCAGASARPPCPGRGAASWRAWCWARSRSSAGRSSSRCCCTRPGRWRWPSSRPRSCSPPRWPWSSSSPTASRRPSSRASRP